MNAISQFHAWFSRTGHWIYDSREEAAATWLKWGIKTLPMAPRGATVASILAHS